MRRNYLPIKISRTLGEFYLEARIKFCKRSDAILVILVVVVDVAIRGSQIPRVIVIVLRRRRSVLPILPFHPCKTHNYLQSVVVAHSKGNTEMDTHHPWLQP